MKIRFTKMQGLGNDFVVLDAVRQDATDEAQMSAAIAPLGEGYLEAALVSLTWKRGVWLTILFGTAAVTAMVLAKWKPTHEWLMYFIPLVVASGGNSGNQSLALGLRNSKALVGVLDVLREFFPTRRLALC